MFFSLLQKQTKPLKNIRKTLKWTETERNKWNRLIAVLTDGQFHLLWNRMKQTRNLGQCSLQGETKCNNETDTILTFKFFLQNSFLFCNKWGGWSGGAKVSCILSHQGVQLILAYSWARPAILVAGKDRGEMFLFLLFLHFHSCSYFFPVPLFHLFYYLFYLFSLSVGDDTKWPTRVDVSLNPNTINL